MYLRVRYPTYLFYPIRLFKSIGIQKSHKKPKFKEDDIMRKNVIKTIICIAVNTAALTIAYKLGKNSGYEDGWNDGEMAGGCKRCVMYDEDSDTCSDIPDFKGLYS